MARKSIEEMSMPEILEDMGLLPDISPRPPTDDEILEAQELQQKLDQMNLEAELRSLEVPPNEREFILTGVTRPRNNKPGHAFRETEAIAKLKAALGRGSRVVVLAGPGGNAKTDAGCRAMANGCRLKMPLKTVRNRAIRDSAYLWVPGRFIDAPTLGIALRRWWTEDPLKFRAGPLSPYLLAPWLLVDDLGEEEAEDVERIGRFFDARDREDRGEMRTLITTNLGWDKKTAKEKKATLSVYGNRVLQRWVASGFAWLWTDEQVRPTGSGCGNDPKSKG